MTSEPESMLWRRMETCWGLRKSEKSSETTQKVRGEVHALSSFVSALDDLPRAVLTDVDHRRSVPTQVVELPEGADGNPFVCDATTVDVCSMAGGTIVQAHAQVWF